MSDARIPLFPLDIVLFPGHALPLHIFEPRYRLMTQHCIETQSAFGIVLAYSGEYARTGCSARIAKILKQYDDGRSDILAVGQGVFHLVRTHEEQPYLEGEVEYLEEDFMGADADVSARLESLFERCHLMLYDQKAPPFETEGGVSLAYHVASELPIDLAFRQTLLEVRSEADRQKRLLERLTNWLPDLAKREQLRGKAAGNGHSHV